MLKYTDYYEKKLDIILKENFPHNIDKKNLSVIKTGMTNASYIYAYGNEKFVIRINGEGTDAIIDRYNEYLVYNQLMKEKNRICDEIVVLNYIEGYKISKYIENVRTCDPKDVNDLAICMNKLKDLHNLDIKTSKVFKLEEQIDFYKKIWKKDKSKYHDHDIVTKRVKSLMNFINDNVKDLSLCHIDAISDNFLLKGKEVVIIDWEYAAMADPDIDIAMFALYAMYSKEELDRLIDIYYKGQCTRDIRFKIYGYMSLGGLLWSNWCEYKEDYGVVFSKYADYQYEMAKYYYDIVAKNIL